MDDNHDKAINKNECAPNEKWVWMVTAEDITEFESEQSLWEDYADAKSAMEKSICELLSILEEKPENLERHNDNWAMLDGREIWSISKIKLHLKNK